MVDLSRVRLVYASRYVRKVAKDMDIPINQVDDVMTKLFKSALLAINDNEDIEIPLIAKLRVNPDNILNYIIKDQFSKHETINSKAKSIVEEKYPQLLLQAKEIMINKYKKELQW
jgi:hypothetical protein